MAEIVGSRLEKLIEHRRESQSSVARAIGVSQPTIGRFISGETRETGKLLELARFLKTSPEYIVGESDERDLPSLQDRRLAFRGAEPEVVRGDSVMVDHIDLRFGLGGEYLDGPASVDKWEMPRALLRHFTTSSVEYLAWAEATGNSMAPTIPNGALVLFDRAPAQLNITMGDDIYAIAYGQVGMIKRLRPMPDGTVKILSDNAVVPPEIAADGEMHVIAKVVAVLGKP